MSLHKPVKQRLLTCNQIQAYRVDAVTQACRRWTIGEHVPQMRVAFGTDHFGTNHAVAHITDFHYRTAYNGRIKAGPAAAGIKLGAGVEQRFITAHAMIDAIGLGAVVLAGKRPFGGFEATDVVLLWIKHRLPFFKGFIQLLHRYTSIT